MYRFIKIQYELGKATKEWVQAQVPKWITIEQLQEIIGGNNNELTI